MSASRAVTTRTSGYRGRRGGLDRISEEDLFFQFAADQAGAAETVGEVNTAEASQPDPPRREQALDRRNVCQGQAILTLGGRSVPIAVCPEPLTRGGRNAFPACQGEPPAAAPGPYSDLPLFELTCSLQEDLARRIEQSHEHRRALEQMFDLTEACETAAGDEPRSNAPDEQAPATRANDAKPQTRPALARSSPDTGPVSNPADQRRRRPSVVDLLDKKATRTRAPFCWRRCFVSAAVCSGLGSAALLMVYWIAG